MGIVIEKIGPKGLEYARFSIDPFHPQLSYVKRHHPEKLDAHVPELPSELSLSTVYQKLTTGSKSSEYTYPA